MKGLGDIGGARIRHWSLNHVGKSKTDPFESREVLLAPLYRASTRRLHALLSALALGSDDRASIGIQSRSGLVLSSRSVLLSIVTVGSPVLSVLTSATSDRVLLDVPNRHPTVQPHPTVSLVVEATICDKRHLGRRERLWAFLEGPGDSQAPPVLHNSRAHGGFIASSAVVRRCIVIEDQCQKGYHVHHGLCC